MGFSHQVDANEETSRANVKACVPPPFPVDLVRPNEDAILRRKPAQIEIEDMDSPSELNEVVLPQAVVGPLTRAAIFLVVCIRQEQDAYTRVLDFCGNLSGLIRAVEFRDVEAGLTCVAGFGSDVWDKLFGSPRPADLHPFQEIRSDVRHAGSSAGDILFHIRHKPTAL